MKPVYPSLIRLQEIRTTRLRLRQWKAADLAPLIRLNADPEVMRFFPAPLYPHQSKMLFKRCRDFINQYGWGVWAVEHQETREFMGLVGLNIPHTAMDFMPCVEIVWRLEPRWWRQGFAYEAAQACLQFGLHSLKLEEILAFTSLLNLPSQQLMQKLGMQYVHNFEHPNLEPTNPLRRHCLYRANQSIIPLSAYSGKSL
ncbi:GNAT family N-acetyltransferase [Alcaligenes endophyticus]|uniref:GNAT family N-acetyltransferase n=1 Tax=Alcaligenes endophyticus TaxID=1929088 RepID=A0ABT8EIN0_9BURK|nr:GNAT family N-acetyltransferase [Alcaligenes endophyticus]MCX5592423.1 GNAT family N-acetyltransferase [Alcaligenes endophyticus]MDN4121148.1 GNAT family N-acetyltransferase [Alcaligenes endophyticus]